jgi:predicted DNA-binding ribbon-helix-helix protein
MASTFTTPSASEASRTDSDGNVIRSVSVHGRRTSVRCEPQIWNALAQICRRESCTPSDVCSYVDERKPMRGLLTSWLQMFILDYFRSSATEDGHGRAGHGQGMFLAQQLERQQRCAKRTDGKSRKRRPGRT